MARLGVPDGRTVPQRPRVPVLRTVCCPTPWVPQRGPRHRASLRAPLLAAQCPDPHPGGWAPCHRLRCHALLLLLLRHPHPAPVLRQWARGRDGAGCWCHFYQPAGRRAQRVRDDGPTRVWTPARLPLPPRTGPGAVSVVPTLHAGEPGVNEPTLALRWWGQCQSRAQHQPHTLGCARCRRLCSGLCARAWAWDPVPRLPCGHDFTVVVPGVAPSHCQWAGAPAVRVDRVWVLLRAVAGAWGCVHHLHRLKHRALDCSDGVRARVTTHPCWPRLWSLRSHS